MNFLNDIEKQLDLPPGPKSEVMRELTSHYDEIREELLASGMPEAQVDEEAEHRLGSPVDVAARLSAVHNSASWRSAVMAAVPFVVSAAYLLCSLLIESTLILTLIFAVPGLLMTVFAVRELVKSRRPVWLATWLAGGFACVSLVASALVTPHSVELSFGSDLEYSNYSISALIAFFIVTIIIARRSGHWFGAFLISAAVTVASIAYLITMEPGMLMTIIAVVAALFSGIMWLACFARFLFELHPYGNPMLASLFLFATVTLRYGQAMEHAYLPAVSELGLAAVIIWLARTPEKRAKIGAIWCGLYVWSLGLSSYVSLAGLPYVLLFAIIPTCVLYLIVSIPLRDSDTEPDEPQIAH